MNDALVVQVFHSSDKFRSVELSAIDCFCRQFGDKLKQVAILGISENKI